MIAQDNKERVKILNTPVIFIVDLLGVSSNTAKKLIEGSYGLTNQQALYLRDNLKLSPDEFNHIYIEYQKLNT